MFYSATERLIYKPPIGPALDPLVVQRRLVIESAGKINEWVSGINSGDPLLVAESEDRLAPLARSAFGLKPFGEPDGHTDSQAMAVLLDYLRYAEGNG